MASEISDSRAPSNTGVATGIGPGDRGLGLGVVAPADARGPAEVRLEQLPDVHSGRDAERVQDDVDRRAVGEEGHVLDRQDLGDDTLVAVTAGELVALLDLALLRDVDAHELVDARRQIVAGVAGELADRDDAAGLAVRHLERRVAHLASLLAEDGAQEALLGGELGLALRRDLADKNVAREDLGADADDAVLVEVGQHVFADVGDLAGDLFRSELGVASLDLVLLDVDRGQQVLLDDALGEDDRVFVVVALPRHERHEEVLAQSQLALLGGGTVGEDVALADRHALAHDGLVVDAGALVGAHELGQVVLVERAVLRRAPR